MVHMLVKVFFFPLIDALQLNWEHKELALNQKLEEGCLQPASQRTTSEGRVHAEHETVLASETTCKIPEITGIFAEGCIPTLCG